MAPPTGPWLPKSSALAATQVWSSRRGCSTSVQHIEYNPYHAPPLQDMAPAQDPTPQQLLLLLLVLVQPPAQLTVVQAPQAPV